jgi:hypothetical protein
MAFYPSERGLIRSVAKNHPIREKGKNSYEMQISFLFVRQFDACIDDLPDILYSDYKTYYVCTELTLYLFRPFDTNALYTIPCIKMHIECNHECCIDMQNLFL